MPELVAARGLTPMQVALFERRYCAQGHRFGPLNFPTPEGNCPFCAVPGFRDAVLRVGFPESLPEVALSPADLAQLTLARSAMSVSSPEILLAAPQSQRLARVRRHRLLRRSVARRSVG